VVIVLKSRVIIVSALIIAMLSCLGLGMNASADNEKVTLTVECKNHETALEGMPWDLYYVADIKSDGSYELANDFAGLPVNLTDLNTSETMALAETLDTFVETGNILPLASGIIDSDGLHNFEGLSYGLYLISGVTMEIDGTTYFPTPSLIAIDKSLGGEATFNYNVYVKPKIKVLDEYDDTYKFTAIAKLFWEKDNSETRPKSVNVTLTRDGEAYKTAVLKESNNWTVKWINLSSKYKWNVIEDVVPDGYTVTYVQNDINFDILDPEEHDIEFIITNTGNYVPVETTTKAQSKPLPYTGQLWWPVPILSAAGMVVFAIGWLMYRHKRKRYEK
jgi:hypothetical protein